MKNQPIRLCPFGLELRAERSGQAGFVSIVLTIIITALLVGGGTYILEKSTSEELLEKTIQETKQNIQSQAQSQFEVLNKKIEELEKKESVKKDEIKNSTWQTYTNEEYNYSFQYPSDWSELEVELGRSGGEILGVSLQRIGLGGITGYEGEIGREYYLSIYPYKDPNQIVGQYRAKSMTQVPFVSNIDGRRVVVADYGGMCAYKDILVFEEDYFFVIHFNCGGESLEKIAAAYGILKSLQFLDNDTSDLQTYANNEWGFSLNFPENWEGYQFEEKDSAVEFGFEDDDIFIISIMSLNDWNLIKDEVGPKPKYITENEDYVFVYSRSQDDKEENWEAAKKTESIIDTFKFLDTNISDWQAYTNDDYGFSINIPSDLKQDDTDKQRFGSYEEKLFAIGIKDGKLDLDEFFCTVEGCRDYTILSIGDRDFYKSYKGGTGTDFNYYTADLDQVYVTFTFANYVSGELWAEELISQILESLVIN